MSKSLDNYIGLAENPDIMFEKAMKIPDKLLKQYFELTTDFSQEEIYKIMDGDIIKAHKVYGEEIIKMYHGADKIEESKKRYDEISKGEIPQNLELINLEEEKINICELILKVGFAKSKSEAKRIIQGNGIKINSELKSDITEEIDLKEEVIIKFGKNKFVKVKGKE